MLPLYRLGKIILTPIYKVIYRYRIINRYNIPNDENMIICCNHVSLIDPILLGISQRRAIRFMVKKEMFKSRISTSFFHALGGFSVDRGRADMNALNTAFDLLRGDDILGIFPEGTRSKNGELLRPKSGVSMIAYKTGCNVLPVAIIPEKKKIKPFRRVIINYGRPMTHEKLGFKEGNPKEFRDATRVIWKEIEKLWVQAKDMF